MQASMLKAAATAAAGAGALSSGTGIVTLTGRRAGTETSNRLPASPRSQEARKLWPVPPEQQQLFLPSLHITQAHTWLEAVTTLLREARAAPRKKVHASMRADATASQRRNIYVCFSTIVLVAMSIFLMAERSPLAV